MSDQTTSTTNRRWLGPVLLVSLILNVFLGAHFAVGVYRHFEFGHHGRSMMSGMPHGMVMRALDDEDRDNIREIMHAQRGELTSHFEEIRAARLALSEAIGAEPYDPEAARLAFAGMRGAMNAIATTSQRALTDAFADLTPDARARIAEAMKQARHGRRGEHHEEQRHRD